MGSQVCNTLHGLLALCTRAAAAAWHVPALVLIKRKDLQRGMCRAERWPREGCLWEIKKDKRTIRRANNRKRGQQRLAGQGLACASCPAEASGSLLQLSALGWFFRVKAEEMSRHQQAKPPHPLLRVSLALKGFSACGRWSPQV